MRVHVTGAYSDATMTLRDLGLPSTLSHLKQRIESELGAVLDPRQTFLFNKRWYPSWEGLTLRDLYVQGGHVTLKSCCHLTIKLYPSSYSYGTHQDAKSRRSLRNSSPSSLPPSPPSSSLQDLVDSLTSEFICPITSELPLDPVVAEDGRIYERKAIEKWLRRRMTSPATGLAMGSNLLAASQVRNTLQTLVCTGRVDKEKAGGWGLGKERE